MLSVRVSYSTSVFASNVPIIERACLQLRLETAKASKPCNDSIVSTQVIAFTDCGDALVELICDVLAIVADALDIIAWRASNYRV